LSAEHDAPFINVDCSWLPPRRFEAELFGDERTDTARRGLLDLIGNGTLVLNEVAALPMSLQARLLRVLDHGTAERVGGSRPFTVAARIVAITRVDLEHAVARRAFRTDLFYALSATSIVVPPLRQRPADVAPLSDHFLARFSELHRHGPKRIVPEVRDALVAYEFAGNVAELQSILEHAMVKCVGDEITLDALPLHLRTCGCRDALSLEEVERAHIASVLRQVAGRKSEAAAILGISRKTLLEKRKRYRLE
jgi:DNA-binding NtrC family response regulator